MTGIDTKRIPARLICIILGGIGVAIIFSCGSEKVPIKQDMTPIVDTTVYYVPQMFPTIQEAVNAAGDWSGDIAGMVNTDGNFSAEPQFCDRSDRDFRLEGNFPRLPANNSCGVQIGATISSCRDVSHRRGPGRF